MASQRPTSNTPAERRAIILCADDYGISAGVNAGIQELASVERISAASALVTLPSWLRYAGRLAELRNHIAIGLHVNLTLGAPLSSMPKSSPSGTFPSIKDLLIRCLSDRLDEDEIATEISRQIIRFEDQTGYVPDFMTDTSTSTFSPVSAQVSFEHLLRVSPMGGS